MKKISLIAFWLMIIFFKGFSQTGYLYQAAFNGDYYEYGYHSNPIMPVNFAPKDIDWERWSILHDGEVYRLYFMPIGKSDRLYQFGYNPRTQAYEYGYRSNPIIPVIGLPDDADVMGFSILFDSSNYRLYFKTAEKEKIYQCAYDANYGKAGAYRFAYESIPEIPILEAPAYTDWTSWTMLHDGKTYRLYFTSVKNENKLYQFGFDGIGYRYGFESTPSIMVSGMPELNFAKKFNITFDGRFYRFYRLLKPR